MGLHSRHYWKEGNDGSTQWGGVGLPAFGRVVKILLIINVAVFVLQLFLDHSPGRDWGVISQYFGMTLNGWWQPWRYLTVQFLHSTSDLWHIVLNMLGLWILGTPLERLWGPRKFLAYYLTCGAMAGLSYNIVMALMHQPGDIPAVGASGGVYGLILAAAILLPHMQIIFLFFPVPIRLAAIILFAMMVVAIVYGATRGVNSNTFSQSAHFGGVAMGAVWLWVVPAAERARQRSGHTRRRLGNGRWRRKMAKLQAEQAEVDRILLKIAHEGINSLTRHEKKVLHDATKHQKEQEQELHKL